MTWHSKSPELDETSSGLCLHPKWALKTLVGLISALIKQINVSRHVDMSTNFWLSLREREHFVLIVLNLVKAAHSHTNTIPIISDFDHRATKSPHTFPNLQITKIHDIQVVHYKNLIKTRKTFKENIPSHRLCIVFSLQKQCFSVVYTSLL